MKSWQITVTHEGKIIDLYMEAITENEARIIAEAHYPNALIISVREM